MTIPLSPGCYRDCRKSDPTSTIATTDKNVHSSESRESRCPPGRSPLPVPASPIPNRQTETCAGQGLGFYPTLIGRSTPTVITRDPAAWA